MHIYSVFDPEFKPYGKVLAGYDTTALLKAMAAIPLPESGTAYEPGIPALEAADIFPELRDRAYGGMPIQLGMCWGHNRKLNCLEYHRDSEVNIGTEDFILLLARQEEIGEGMQLDTEKVKAFQAPAGAVDDPALCALPCGRRKRLPGGGGPAPGHQHGQARPGRKGPGGQAAAGPEQVAAGPWRRAGGCRRGLGRPAGRQHRPGLRASLPKTD